MGKGGRLHPRRVEGIVGTIWLVPRGQSHSIQYPSETLPFLHDARAIQLGFLHFLYPERREGVCPA